MIPIIVGIAFVVIGTLAYIVMRTGQDFSDANQVIPGVATKAPKEWAGAHSPEARLHRRLRDAMEAVRVNADLDQLSLVEVRSSLEEQALATDDKLIAAAVLPKGYREPQIDAIAETVGQIEEVVASLVELRGPGVIDVEREIESVRTRVRLIAEARAELAASEPMMSDLADLRDRMAAEAVPDGPAAPEPLPPTDSEQPDGGTTDPREGDTIG